FPHFVRWNRHSRLVLLNREGSFRTESFPMENCRRRQSSSVSVLLPTGDSGNGVTVQQESIPGRGREAEIPRITFTIQNTSSGPRNWGPGGGDFSNCSTVREAVVSLYIHVGQIPDLHDPLS